jgi:hypothetical protein
VTDDQSELEALAAERDALQQEIAVLHDEQERLLAQLASLQEPARRGDRDVPYAELARLRSEAYNARDAQHRLQRLRRRRSVRAAMWASTRSREVTERVTALVRPGRASGGAATAPPAPRLEPLRPGSDVDGEIARLERLADRPPVSVIIPIFNASRQEHSSS